MLSPRRQTANLRPIPILVYHQIAEAPPRGTPFRSLCVSPGAFGRQMFWLRTLGYRGLSMAALLPYLEGRATGKVVGITFDDGYVNNLEHALPVLRAARFSSTCYAVSRLLGQSNVWDHAMGIPPSPLMNEEQLRQWCAGGQELGAHTQHHVRLPQLAADAARTEIQGSRDDLRAVSGTEVDAFCYPYGEFAEPHVDAVAAAGYSNATTTARGRVRAGLSMFELPRVPVLRSTSLPLFWAKIATGYEDRSR